jgi:hypothetical protein
MSAIVTCGRSMLKRLSHSRQQLVKWPRVRFPPPNAVTAIPECRFRLLAGATLTSGTVASASLRKPSLPGERPLLLVQRGPDEFSDFATGPLALHVFVAS